MDKGLASAKVYRQAGVQQLKEGPNPQFVTSQPCGAHPWGSVYCTQRRNSSCGCAHYLTGHWWIRSCTHPGGTVKSRRRQGQRKSWRQATTWVWEVHPEDKLPTAKAPGPARRHPEAGPEPDTLVKPLRQGLVAQPEQKWVSCAMCRGVGGGPRWSWSGLLRLVGALGGVQS